MRALIFNPNVTIGVIFFIARTQMYSLFKINKQGDRDNSIQENGSVYYHSKNSRCVTLFEGLVDGFAKLSQMNWCDCVQGLKVLSLTVWPYNVTHPCGGLIGLINLTNRS